MHWHRTEIPLGIPHQILSSSLFLAINHLQLIKTSDYELLFSHLSVTRISNVLSSADACKLFCREDMSIEFNTQHCNQYRIGSQGPFIRQQPTNKLFCKFIYLPRETAGVHTQGQANALITIWSINLLLASSVSQSVIQLLLKAHLNKTAAIASRHHRHCWSWAWEDQFKGMSKIPQLICGILHLSHYSVCKSVKFLWKVEVHR